MLSLVPTSKHKRNILAAIWLILVAKIVLFPDYIINVYRFGDFFEYKYTVYISLEFKNFTTVVISYIELLRH